MPLPSSVANGAMAKELRKRLLPVTAVEEILVMLERISFRIQRQHFLV